MRGQTNAIARGGGSINVYENLNINLISNQSNNDDLLGAIVTVEYDQKSEQYTWEGTNLVALIPGNKEYSVSFSDVAGYKTPDTVIRTSVTGNSYTIVPTYKTEQVTVKVTSESGSVEGLIVTINGIDHILDTTGICTDKVAFETTYSISVNELDGYMTPETITRVALFSNYAIDLKYETALEKLTVNVSGIDSGFEITVLESNIIDGYKIIDYIEATGTQWIDTGFTPNQDTSIYMDVIPTTVEAGVQSGIFFGSSYPVNKHGIEAYIYDGNFTFEYGGTSSVKDTKSSANVRYQVAIEKNVSTAYLNGEEYYKVVNPEMEFTATKTLHLCSLPREAQHFGLLKIFSCQIYDNETLVRDYIPVISKNGIYGLYDKVNKTFYGSNTSDQFIGADYVYGDIIGTSTELSKTFYIPTGTNYIVYSSKSSGCSVPSKSFTAGSSQRTVEMKYLNHGVWIKDVNGNYFTSAQWSSSLVADCVVISNSSCIFGIALANAHSTTCKWSNTNVLINNIVTTTTSADACTDYLGVHNTQQIISQMGTGNAPAAEYCTAYKSASGANGYLGSMGEWNSVIANSSAVTTALNKCGGTALSGTYWASTQGNSSSAWSGIWSTGPGRYSKTDSYLVRAFIEL